ncbi:hypothetical protein GCM10010185_49910 [Saccharothrix coeruleofusca]|uniref:Uncharacterized protein n=1 Tax=Saccharothrix coeruleofusca TaxID=33919 RepID=A0A918AQU2_9PSEU|nr:hypothetical protein GCM10010185_49910 [Saccharothrix coeruleofusca]
MEDPLMENPELPVGPLGADGVDGVDVEGVPEGFAFGDGLPDGVGFGSELPPPKRAMSESLQCCLN